MRFAISPAMASKHVRALEERVGGKLLHRTTRRRSLTDIGRAYFERCKAILAAVEAAESRAHDSGGAVRGTLRVTAPVSFGACRLAPALVDFLRLHPEVRVELALNDRVVDLIDEEFDVAIRIGRLIDSTLMARPLAPYRMCVCASPSYLARHRAPRTPSISRATRASASSSRAAATPGPRWAREARGPRRRCPLGDQQR